MKTWTSFLKPSGKSGRIERSMMRAAQDLVVARASFALDEAARDLAGGVGLLAVFDEEREEVERTLVVAHRDGREDHRVAERDEADPAACLAMRPVSMTSLRPANVFSMRCIIVLSPLAPA